MRDSDTTPLVSILMEGAPAAGKTALAAHLAALAEYPYIKLISPEGLVNQTESARCFKVTHLTPTPCPPPARRSTKPRPPEGLVHRAELALHHGGKPKPKVLNLSP